MKVELSRQTFEKYSNIKFHENQSSGSRVVPCRRAGGRTDGQTDRHDEGSFSKFCEHFLKSQIRKWLNYESSSHHGPTQLSRYQCTELEVIFGWIYIRVQTLVNARERQ